MGPKIQGKQVQDWLFIQAFSPMFVFQSLSFILKYLSLFLSGVTYKESPWGPEQGLHEGDSLLKHK